MTWPIHIKPAVLNGRDSLEQGILMAVANSALSFSDGTKLPSAVMADKETSREITRFLIASYPGKVSQFVVNEMREANEWLHECESQGPQYRKVVRELVRDIEEDRQNEPDLEIDTPFSVRDHLLSSAQIRCENLFLFLLTMDVESGTSILNPKLRLGQLASSGTLYAVSSSRYPKIPLREEIVMTIAQPYRRDNLDDILEKYR